jgi:hypothetical protein
VEQRIKDLEIKEKVRLRQEFSTHGGAAARVWRSVVRVRGYQRQRGMKARGGGKQRLELRTGKNPILRVISSESVACFKNMSRLSKVWRGEVQLRRERMNEKGMRVNRVAWSLVTSHCQWSPVTVHRRELECMTHDCMTDGKNVYMLPRYEVD